jgi:hypothetical protein
MKPRHCLSSACGATVLVLVLAEAVSWPCRASAQEAVTAPIALQGIGPYHRLALPAAIYGLAAYSDLRDLRIRNAAGQAVPYAWLRNEAATPRTASQRVPIFALPGTGASTAASDALLAFKVRADGSLVLAKAAAQAPGDATQWLIDVSQVAGNLLQARFEVAPGTHGLFAFTLEASDDMRQWHLVGGQEQLVLLNRDNEKIERLAVDLGSIRARFLRLRWTNPRQGAVLTGVGVDSVQELEPMDALEWSGALKPERCGFDHCDYRLPRGLPAQSIQIALAESNTLAKIQILGLLDAVAGSATPARPPRNPLYALRHQRKQPSTTVAPEEILLVDTVVYRLTQADGEARSPVLSLDGEVYPRLRLRTKGPFGVMGATPPTIDVATIPRTLVFLAQGQAPFSLAWSATALAVTPALLANGAPIALATLVPAYVPGKQLAADSAFVTLTSAPQVLGVSSPASAATMSNDSKIPQRKFWLWAALGFGLLLLAGMARSLFKTFQKGEASPDTLKG